MILEHLITRGNIALNPKETTQETENNMIEKNENKMNEKIHKNKKKQD